MKTISKFDLIHTFAKGLRCDELGFVVINSIEREDGSNKNYNVTGQTFSGETKTMFVKTN